MPEIECLPMVFVHLCRAQEKHSSQLSYHAISTALIEPKLTLYLADTSFLLLLRTEKTGETNRTARGGVRAGWVLLALELFLPGMQQPAQYVAAKPMLRFTAAPCSFSTGRFDYDSCPQM